MVRPGRPTIPYLIAQGITENGGRASLKQIYSVVTTNRPATPLESIRSDLYRGRDAGKFSENGDKTWSLGNVPSSSTLEVSLQPPLDGVIIKGDLLRRYAPKESELEEAFIRNYRHIFGLGSLYIPLRKLIGNRIRKITDGLLLDINDVHRPRCWIVELELSKHDLEHIEVQVLGFLRAFDNETSLRILSKSVEGYLDKHPDYDKWYQPYLEEAMEANNSFPSMLIDSMLHERKEKRGVIIVIDEFREELRDVVQDISKVGEVKVVEFGTFKINGENVHSFWNVDTAI
jgi:hypothetical protein